jgi:hypothetical protein
MRTARIRMSRPSCQRKPVMTSISLRHRLGDPDDVVHRGDVVDADEPGTAATASATAAAVPVEPLLRRSPFEELSDEPLPRHAH